MSVEVVTPRKVKVASAEAVLNNPVEPSSTQPSEKELLRAAFSPERLNWKNVDWVVAGFMLFVHVGAIAAPFFFSWTALGVCIFLHWLTCSIGICLGYHRYLSHRSMKLKTPAEFFVLLCGTLSAEGTPLRWSATHRLHHQMSDQEGDPHSPNDGSWWSHILWVFPARTTKETEVLYQKYCPELANRPMIKFFERTFGLWLLVSALGLFGAGYLLSGWMGVTPLFGALSLLLWGLCVRMVFAYHSTWFVNSATHLWGYRNYETRDMSRNLWWVAILAYGEGWHNNHHAHPSVAPAGHRWWEVDITWWAIKALRFCGLATDVKDKLPQRGTVER